MLLKKVLCSIREARAELVQLIQQEFCVSGETAVKVFDKVIAPHFERLRNNIYLAIEFPYIDRMYRDSYYAYHAMKLNPYRKDCIRISFFAGPITGDEFRDVKLITSLQQRYLGFMILRPTIPDVIGRNVISPTALRRHDFLSINTKFETTADNVKLFVHGFPHASQDEETMTCAEIMIWCLSEYFSQGSAIYKSVMPSEILHHSRDRTNEKILPSNGLDLGEINYVVRALGFANQTYVLESYGDELKNLMSCYISSGLPIITIVDNIHHRSSGHVILTVGHSITTDRQIDQLKAISQTDVYARSLLAVKHIRLFDNDDIDRELVLIDDGAPVYQVNNFKDPLRHRKQKELAHHKITQIIAPLHPAIRMDAVVAKAYIKEVLLHVALDILPHTDLFIRTFFTSSRAYKDYILKQAGITPAIREEILSRMMGEYIWVGELTTKTLIKTRKAQGMIIIDASEVNTVNNNAFIFAGYGDNYFTPDPIYRELKETRIPLGHFNIFINNLKGF